MKFTNQDIIKSAREILEFFEDCNINSLNDLKPYCDNHSGFRPCGGKFIEISSVAHGRQKPAISVSYIIAGGGIPIDIKIDELGDNLSLYHLMCKSAEKLQDYEPAVSDNFGNLVQNKLLHSNFSGFKKELENLASSG